MSWDESLEGRMEHLGERYSFFFPPLPLPSLPSLPFPFPPLLVYLFCIFYSSKHVAVRLTGLRMDTTWKFTFTEFKILKELFHSGTTHFLDIRKQTWIWHLLDSHLCKFQQHWHFDCSLLWTLFLDFETTLIWIFSLPLWPVQFRGLWELLFLYFTFKPGCFSWFFLVFLIFHFYSLYNLWLQLLSLSWCLRNL